MKIVQLASGDLWAGAEVQLYGLVHALRQIPDVELEVVLLNHGELEMRLRQAGFPVIVFDERRLGSLAIGWRLLGYLRRVKPDIVHTHRQKENVLGSIAAALAEVPSLRTVHGQPEEIPSWWRLDKRLYRLSDQLCGKYLQRHAVAVSQQLGGVLAARFHASKLSVIENGIDLELISRESAERSALPGTAGRQRVALIGRLVPIKRVDLFVRIAQELCQRQPKAFDFYIVGDGPEAERCRSMIREAGLEERIHMLGFRFDATAVLADMDLLLMTSDHEGLPMILLEAMSLGVPVVASAVGGIPSVLDHGRYGRLVYDQRTESYVEAAFSLLEDSSARAQLACLAAARVRDCYSAARSAEQYSALYRRLFARDGAVARADSTASPNDSV